MKFTVNWLQQYVDLTITAEVLADRLTMAGLEVDGVAKVFHECDGVRVAEILAVSPHPDADRLVLCQVAVGEERLQVVCGAPNARVGLFTAIALPGTKLPSGLVIKKSTIRGQQSHGMLCSEKDLGISENHVGIMELLWLTKSGGKLVEELGLRDTVIEVDLTPNRPDCTSVIGIGREAAAFCGTRLRPPVTAADTPRLTGENIPFSVTVEDDDCPRYAARLLTGITIGPSPWWLRKRLLSVGLRPINNVVDVTNFVMLEYGQPLHAFDFDKLVGKAIVVRKPRPGETLTTLDGAIRPLDPTMMLICDAEKPVAVAGVMGGANSEVDDATTAVLLESACFNPISVRRTARKLNMATDASYRFERGVDPKLAPIAMERAVRLLCEVAGATVIDNGVDWAAGVQERAAITLRVSRTSDLLGHPFTGEEIAALLAGIDIPSTPHDADTLLVTPPSFRVDLEREVDLIEEVARLKGYNEFPYTMPLVPMAAAWEDPARRLRQDVARVLVSLGFSEAINYSFVNPAHFDMMGLVDDDPRRRTVHLLNPLAEDQSVLRTMLLPGLLENVRRNVSYQVTDVRLFETGKCFIPADNANEQPREETWLTSVLSGRRSPGAPLLHAGEERCDIYDGIGAIEALQRELRLADLRFVPRPHETPLFCDPENCLALTAADEVIGHCGRISPSVLARFGIKQDVFFFSLLLDKLLVMARLGKQFVALPKFPSVKWDIAVVVPEQVGAGEIVAAIRGCGEALVEQAELFDLYRGDALGPGRKSVAIKVTYRSAEQTLDDETVAVVHNRIVAMILDRFHGQLREV
ncbi:MAG: phenylalanine--tRNA ligase subunit beta [Thermodesulfobacteriota bacterium]